METEIGLSRLSMYHWTDRIHVGFPNLQVELSTDQKGTRIFSEISDDVNKTA